MAILRIELLEDCDMNSGRVMNTYFADDVFYDDCGLPYIPAWIIRNSLAKAAEDLGLGLGDDDFLALLGPGASLMLDDALVEGYESMRQAILSNEFGGILLRNPQNVLNGSGLVKVRKTSGIGGEQFVRMLAKGTIFEAWYDVDESNREAFEHIIGHTRGVYVGHTVCALFTIDGEWPRPSYLASDPLVDLEGERSRLEYDLHVLSRTTFYDRISDELDASPFVSGADIHDALACRDGLADLFSGTGEVRCSFAYINDNGHRGLPVPASYSTKKQDKNDLRDRCSLGRRPDDFDQIKGMGRVFIDDPDGAEIHAMSVREEQGILQLYHEGELLSRPYRAIGPGQVFKGFIEGPTDQIGRILESLSADGNVRIGDQTALGFGNAFLQVTSVAPVRRREPVLSHEITVLLASPARLYQDGIYEASAQKVLEEVQGLIGGGVELEIVRNSQKTCGISIYNKAWDEFEPMEYAMQSGSVYRMRAKDGSPFDVAPVMGGAFIGGHNDAGYGEVIILPAVDIYYRRISYGDQHEKDFALPYKVDPNPGRRLMRSLYQSNANALASYMGATEGEAYVNDTFVPGPMAEISTTLCDDFDLEQVFEAYMDSLKEAGLNAIRRGRNA